MTLARSQLFVRDARYLNTEYLAAELLTVLGRVSRHLADP